MKGFSLIEVLISASVLITGIAGLAMGLTNLSHQQEHLRHRAAASTVAGNAMEELIRLQDTRALGPGVSTGTYDGRGQLASTGNYAVVRSVVDGNPMPGGRKIEVVVTWRERDAPKELKLKTYAYLATP